MLKKGTPRHSQISHWLRTKIGEGDFQTDEKLPSENELAEQFGVSRVTVRRALQSLENEKLIYRCQGLGSFVSDSRAPHPLVRLEDFSEELNRAGIEARSEIRQIETVDAPQWLSGILDIGEGRQVVCIRRLRLGDGEPVAYDITWLPLLYGQLLDERRLETSTIFGILEEEYDIPVRRGCFRISAEVADEQLSSELKITPGAPLLLIDRTSFTIGNKPVCYQKRYCRSDRVSYGIVLERDRNRSPGSQEMPLREFAPEFRPGSETGDS